MEKLKNTLLYSGLTKESYEKVLPQVREENRKNMFVFSVFAALGFLAGLIMRFAGNFGMPKRSILLLAILFLVMAMLSKTVASKNRIVCDIMVYLFTIILLGGGVYAGIYQRTERTTLLLAFFVFSAVLFSQRLVFLLMIILGTELVYLILIARTQSPALIMINTVNTLIFCIIGILVAVYIMRMKYKKHETDYLNKILLERDSLTGVYNRHCYDEELGRIAEKRESVIICAFDVNGLKKVNDSKGHLAGDELLIGAAECIVKVFGPHGKVFRTGGDEYMALLPGKIENIDKLRVDFAKAQSEWKGKLVDTVNVSCGIVPLEDTFEENLFEALKKADELMYEEKRKYYAAKEINI